MIKIKVSTPIDFIKKSIITSLNYKAPSSYSVFQVSEYIGNASNNSIASIVMVHLNLRFIRSYLINCLFKTKNHFSIMNDNDIADNRSLPLRGGMPYFRFMIHLSFELGMYYQNYSNDSMKLDLEISPLIRYNFDRIYGDDSIPGELPKIANSEMALKRSTGELRLFTDDITLNFWYYTNEIKKKNVYTKGRYQHRYF